MFYKKNTQDVLKSLNTSFNGLSKEEAQERLKKHGYNELTEKEKSSVIKLFLETFKDPLVIILLIAALVQVFLGEVIESSIIHAVVTLNAILSVVQSKKAEGSLDSLKKLSIPYTKVIRDNEKITISSRDLVVGDIVLVEAGDYVPAEVEL